MGDNSESFKITEARYLIIIPILITGICVVLDITANISSGGFCCMETIQIAENICRNIIGYFFPSILSIVIAMLWQQRIKREDIYGISNDKVGGCVIITAIFATLFIIYLMLFSLIVSVIFIVCMTIYCILVYRCLNVKITAKSKDDKTQEDFLMDYCTRDK